MLLDHPALPHNGDVLVSRPTARVEHEISIVPRPPHLTCATHDQAIAQGSELAERLQVDVWLTEDHRHFLRVAAFRREAMPADSRVAGGVMTITIASEMARLFEARGRVARRPVDPDPPPSEDDDRRLAEVRGRIGGGR